MTEIQHSRLFIQSKFFCINQNLMQKVPWKNYIFLFYTFRCVSELYRHLNDSKNCRLKKKKKTENFVTADIKTFEKIPKHWQARDVIKKNKWTFSNYLQHTYNFRLKKNEKKRILYIIKIITQTYPQMIKDWWFYI